MPRPDITPRTFLPGPLRSDRTHADEGRHGAGGGGWDELLREDDAGAALGAGVGIAAR